MSPRPVFDPVLHEPHRLRLATLLVPHMSRPFAALREELDLSDSAMSKHVRALREAGHVRVDKVVVDGRTITTIALTDDGREALCCHVSELQRMARLVSTRPRRGRH